MTTYTLDTHATIKQLEDAGMDSKQAEAVVAAISRSDAELATKADLKTEIAEVKTQIAQVKTEIAAVSTNIDKLASSTRADLADGRADVANEFKALYRHLWLMAAGIVATVLALGRYVF